MNSIGDSNSSSLIMKMSKLDTKNDVSMTMDESRIALKNTNFDTSMSIQVYKFIHLLI